MSNSSFELSDKQEKDITLLDPSFGEKEAKGDYVFSANVIEYDGDGGSVTLGDFCFSN